MDKEDKEELASVTAWELVDELDRALEDGTADQFLAGTFIKTSERVSRDEVFAAALLEMSSMRKRLILSLRSSEILGKAMDSRKDNYNLEKCLRETDHLDEQYPPQWNGQMFTRREG